MLFDAIKTHDPYKTALHDDTHTVSYGDLTDKVLSRAQSLHDVSVLGIALDNSVDWVLWDLAALHAGIPCVPVPPFFTPDQVFHSLQTAGVSHLLSPQGMQVTGISKPNALPAGTAKVTFTSGTTGNPKGVCLPQSAMQNVAKSIVNVLGHEFAGHHACVLPLSVLLENIAGVYAGLMAGCTLHLSGLHRCGQTYEHIHDMLHQTKANSAILVPEILKTLMAQVAVTDPLPHLKFIAVGGSKIDPALIHQARAAGLPVYEGYGLSECASVLSLNTPQHDKPGTVGKLLPHVQARIVNGEIIVRTPGFLGYIGGPEHAAFNTGDLGTLDHDGFLSISGRKKNTLITSYGRNISPEWVEAALLAQRGIAQALVHGDAQPHLHALIVLASDATDIQPAIDNANRNLPSYAQVHHIQIVPPFTVQDGTLTGTGRPRRKEIIQRYIKENTYELLQSTR